MEIINTQPSNENDNETWGYACDIRKMYGPFTKYNIEETSELFKTGKRKYKCVFSAVDGFIYAVHDASICINKKTNEEFYSVRILSINKWKMKNKHMDEEQKRIREELKAEENELNELNELNKIEPLNFSDELDV